MSIDTVREVAARFLSNKEPEVLAIKGDWGTGKTHVWKEIIFAQRKNIKLDNYCYISLFGIKSLAELKTAIFLETLPVKSLDRKLSIHKAKKALPWLEKIKGVPYLNNLSISIDNFSSLFISNTIICFDDFERSRIKAGEILGFISYLKEEKKDCKVAIIFNENELKEKEKEFKKYREKLIDIELRFAPTVDEVTELAFPRELPYREYARQLANVLSINNIRVLRKIAFLINQICKEISGLHEIVSRQAVHTIVLVSWIFFEPNEEKPNMEFLRNWLEHLVHRSLHGKEKELVPDQSKWAAILTKYDLNDFDEFDNAISIVIEHGYIEESGLLDEAQKIDARVSASEKENSFSKTWQEYFHNTLADNESELIKALTESLKDSVRHVSLLNLDRTVSLFRELGYDDEANLLIEYYIDKNDDRKKIFDLESNSFAGDIRDSKLRERCKHLSHELNPLPQLIDVATSISNKDSWSRVELEVLESASSDDFYHLFKNYCGDNLSGIVGSCLQFRGFGDENSKKIGSNVQSALERIGKESKLNASRIRKFGINVEPIV